VAQYHPTWKARLAGEIVTYVLHHNNAKRWYKRLIGR